MLDVMGDDRFLFTFHDRSDKDQVLEGQLWTFDNHVFLLKEVRLYGLPIVDQIVFWVMFYGMPIRAWREEVVKRIARQASVK